MVENETEDLYDKLLWNWCECCHKKLEEPCIFSNLEEVDFDEYERTDT